MSRLRLIVAVPLLFALSLVGADRPSRSDDTPTPPQPVVQPPAAGVHVVPSVPAGGGATSVSESPCEGVRAVEGQIAALQARIAGLDKRIEEAKRTGASEDAIAKLEASRAAARTQLAELESMSRHLPHMTPFQYAFRGKKRGDIVVFNGEPYWRVGENLYGPKRGSALCLSIVTPGAPGGPDIKIAPPSPMPFEVVPIPRGPKPPAK